MDEKMRSALNEWFQEEKTVHIYEIAEFVLDYLRSQQEPTCYVPEPVIQGLKERGKYAAVLFDTPAANGIDVALYAYPVPSAPAVPAQPAASAEPVAAVVRDHDGRAFAVLRPAGENLPDGTELYAAIDRAMKEQA